MVPMWRVAFVLQLACGHELSRDLVGAFEVGDQSAVGDWRCLDAVEKSWGKYRKATSKLETSKNPAMGDVCRDPFTQDYFCPVGCKQVLSLPFCVSAAITEDPCRAPPEAQPNTDGCVLSEDPTVGGEHKVGATLLRRRMRTSNHGDVCRSGVRYQTVIAESSDCSNVPRSKQPILLVNQVVDDVWFCPKGCYYNSAVPFCTLDGSEAAPCRIPFPSPSPSSPSPSSSIRTSSSIRDGSETEEADALLAAQAALDSFSTDKAAAARGRSAAGAQAEAGSSAAAAATADVETLKQEYGDATLTFPSAVQPVLGTYDDPLPMLVNLKDFARGTERVYPFFFHVPKAAGTTVEKILVSKYGLKSLPTGDIDDLNYIERSQAFQRGIVQYIKSPLLVSDDCTRNEQRGPKFTLWNAGGVESNLKVKQRSHCEARLYPIFPFFPPVSLFLCKYDACAFFGRAQIRVQAFTILREPVSRIVSLFWYKKDSTVGI